MEREKGKCIFYVLAKSHTESTWAFRQNNISKNQKHTKTKSSKRWKLFHMIWHLRLEDKYQATKTKTHLTFEWKWKIEWNNNQWQRASENVAVQLFCMHQQYNNTQTTEKELWTKEWTGKKSIPICFLLFHLLFLVRFSVPSIPFVYLCVCVRALCKLKDENNAALKWNKK